MSIASIGSQAQDFRAFRPILQWSCKQTSLAGFGVGVEEVLNSGSALDT